LLQDSVHTSNTSQQHACTRLQQHVSTVLLRSAAKSVRERHALKELGTRVSLAARQPDEINSEHAIDPLNFKAYCGKRIIPLSSLANRHLSASMLWLAAAICNMSTPWLSTPSTSRPRCSRRSKMSTAIACFPEGRDSYLFQQKCIDDSQIKPQMRIIRFARPGTNDNCSAHSLSAIIPAL